MESPIVTVHRVDDSYEHTWIVASPDGRCYVADKITGVVRWYCDTGKGFLHLSNRGDVTDDYVDLMPQCEDLLENNIYPYHFTHDGKPKLMDLDTEEEFQRYLKEHYMDSLTNVIRRENVYHFDYENGDTSNASLTAFRIIRVDYYLHRSRPDWSLRYSRISAWFPSFSNKERHRMKCSVLHLRDSHRFIQACNKFNLHPLPTDSPVTQLINSNKNLNDLCTINRKISLGEGDEETKGKHGTLFYKGTYDGIKAVVKKVKRSDDPEAINHKKILRLSGYHENVVAFLGSETDGVFEFFAFEECGITLHEYIKKNSYKEMSEESLKLMRGLVDGVKHLHAKGIAHMNLNPHNILVNDDDTIKICGLGNSKLLEEVTDGERPDLHLIAHTLLYLISDGDHEVPDVEDIGENFEYRILDEAYVDNLKLKVKSAEAWDLLEKIGMLGPTQLRPIESSATLAMHPQFWSVPQRLGFIGALGDHLREGDPTQQLVNDLENRLNVVLASSNGSWFSVIGGYNPSQPTLLSAMQYPPGKRQPNYTDFELVSLIKFCRNAHSHIVSFSHNQNPAHQQILLQELGNNEFELEQNLRTKYPLLLKEAYNVVANHQTSIQSLRKYYQ